MNIWFSQVTALKNPPANAWDTGDTSSIPGLGRFPGGRHGNPLQYSCPETPMDRGAWWTTDLGVAKSGTWLKRQHMCIPNTQYSILHKTSRYSINTCWMNELIDRTKGEREHAHLHTPSSWMCNRWSWAQGGRRKPSFHDWTKLRKSTCLPLSTVPKS